MSETIGELIQLQSKNFQISLDESGVFLLFLCFFLLYLWSMAKFLDFFLCQILIKCMKVWQNLTVETQYLSFLLGIPEQANFRNLEPPS